MNSRPTFDEAVEIAQQIIASGGGEDRLHQFTPEHGRHVEALSLGAVAIARGEEADLIAQAETDALAYEALCAGTALSLERGWEISSMLKTWLVAHLRGDLKRPPRGRGQPKAPGRDQIIAVAGYVLVKSGMPATRNEATEDETSAADASGRFTGFGAYEVAPIPREPLPTAVEAAEKIRGDLVAFRAAAEAYDPKGDEPAPVLAIAADPGIGKSTICREVWSAEPLRLDGDVVFHTPTLALAEEAAGDTRGHVTKGRTKENCQRFHLVDSVVRAGLPVRSTLCKRVLRDEDGHPNGPPSLCPHFESCTYQRQWADLPEKPQLRYRATVYAVLPGDGSGRTEAARIIDETTWGQHVRVKDVPLDFWQRPRADLDLERRAQAAKALVGALETGDLAGFLGSYTVEDFLRFAQAEQPPSELEKFPSAADDNLASMLSTRNANYPLAGRMAKVWQLLHDCKTRALITTQRLRIVRDVPAPGTGEPRDVLRLCWLREPDRSKPTLLLDADASPLITERLWPGAQIVKAEAEPIAHVTQITDKTLSKHALLKSRKLRDEAASLIRYQVWLDRLLGGSGLLVGATRSVVAQLFRDAGHAIDDITAQEASAYMQETPLHGASWIWFGSAALGRNDWADFTTVVIMGREELSPAALEDLGRALFGDHGEPLQFMDPDAPNFPEVEARYTMHDGSGRAVVVRRHPDPRIAEIQSQTRECATRQLIERLRLVRAATPKRVVVACKIPLPDFPIDELATWGELVPSRLQAAMAEAAQDGRHVLRLSAAGLAADAPQTFANVEAAKKWLRKGGRAVVDNAIAKGGPAPNKTLLPVGPPLTASVQFKREGVSGSATPALTWGGDPRAVVEETFGSLAAFEIIARTEPPPQQEAEAMPEIIEPERSWAEHHREHARPDGSTVRVVELPAEVVMVAAAREQRETGWIKCRPGRRTFTLDEILPLPTRGPPAAPMLERTLNAAEHPKIYAGP